MDIEEDGWRRMWKERERGWGSFTMCCGQSLSCNCNLNSAASPPPRASHVAKSEPDFEDRRQVFNYNTHKKETAFEAHPDYVTFDGRTLDSIEHVTAVAYILDIILTSLSTSLFTTGSGILS